MSAWSREQRPGEWDQSAGPPRTYAQLIQEEASFIGQAANETNSTGSKLMSEEMERRFAIELAFVKPFFERLAEVMGRKVIEGQAKVSGVGVDRRKKTCIYFSEIPPPIISGDRSVASHKVPDALKLTNAYMSMVSRCTKAEIVPADVMLLAIDKQNVERCLDILMPAMTPIMKMLDEIVKRPDNAKIEMTPMILTQTQRSLQRGRQCEAILTEWSIFAGLQWIREKERILEELRAVEQGTDIVEYTRKTEDEVEKTRKNLWHQHSDQQHIFAEQRRKRYAAQEAMYAPPPPAFPHHRPNYIAPMRHLPPVPFAAPSVSRMSGPSFDHMDPGMNTPPPPRSLMSSTPLYGHAGPAHDSWRPGANAGTFPSRKRPSLLGDAPLDRGREWPSPSYSEHRPRNDREPQRLPGSAQEERNRAGERTHRRIQILVDLIKERFPDPSFPVFDNPQFQKALRGNYSTLEQAEDLLVSLQDLWTSVTHGAPAVSRVESVDLLAEPSHPKKPECIKVNGMSFRRVSDDTLHLFTPGLHVLYRNEDGSQLNTVKVVCVKNGKVVIDYEDNISIVTSSDLYLSNM